MADKVAEQVANVDEDAPKTKEAKEVVDPETKKEVTEDKVSHENGDAKTENGKKDAADDVDSKDSEPVCPVKRKSTTGETAEEAPAEGASPEKKAKLDEAAAEAESNGEAEVAA